MQMIIKTGNEMKPGSWWTEWAALGIVVSSTELIVNAFFGRFPLYLYKGGHPLIAIPIGSLIEVLVWTTISLLCGGLIETIRRILSGGESWHIGGRVTAALILEAFLARSLLAVYMRNGLFRYHAPPEFHDTWIIVGAVTAAVITGVLAARYRRATDSSFFKWDNLRVVLFMSALAAVYVVGYNRWMSTTEIPLPNISGWVLGVAAVAVSLAYFCRARNISSKRLAVLFGSAALTAVSIVTIYYAWPPPDQPPDVIISLWDTARASSMSLYGNEEETTPGLESISARGVVFDNANTPSNYTYPSHISYFTGKTYREHGFHVGDGDEVMRYRNEFTLPERLKELGYYSVLLTENSWVLACDKGFDEVGYFPMLAAYFGPPPRTCEFGDFPPLRKYAGPFPGRMIIDAIEYFFDGYYTFTLERIQLRRVQELLIRGRRIGPLFIFWNWFTVHDRYHPYTKWPVGEEVDNYDFPAEYALSIRYADERFMKVYRLLKNCGRLDQTVLIVTSDHGEFLGERSLWGHNKTLFEPVLRVPLLVTNPALKGKRIQEPVSMTALYKLVEYIATDPESLKDEDIEKVMTSRPEVIAEHGYLPEKYSREYRWCYTVIEKGSQYIFDPLIGSYGGPWSGKSTELLLENPARFDRDEKPGKDAAARSEQLKGKYESYLRMINSHQGERTLPLGSGGSRERRLRALGYL